MMKLPAIDRTILHRFHAREIDSSPFRRREVISIIYEYRGS